MRSIECMEHGRVILARHERLRANGEKALLYEASPDGPAEYGRLVRGRLLRPARCDTCNCSLPAGAQAMAFSAWQAGWSEVRAWERLFLDIDHDGEGGG